MHSLPALASKLKLGAVYLKDETSRLTLPAFKIFGASWAVHQLILALTHNSARACSSFAELRALAEEAGRYRLITASDGNHGRAVARMAAWVGWEAKVFMPAGTVSARVRAIEGEGAEVVVIDGTYDEAVRLAAAEQDEHTLLVQDTSWPGYETVPSWIVEGYVTLLLEIEEALTEQSLPQPDVVLIPVGVGALAGAVIRYYRRPGIAHPPKLIGVEPLGAECALESLTFDEIVTVPGQADTIMAGLNCGTLASIVWPDVRNGLDGVVAMEDRWARDAMHTLAASGINAGESGAATLGALLALLQSPELVPMRRAMGISPTSHVLLFATEGITDPVMYEKIMNG